MLGNVVIHGNAMAGCNVWRKLSEEGIQVLLIPARGTGEPAWIGKGLSTSIMTRLVQHRIWADNSLKLSAAVWIVKAKLESLQNLLKMLNKDRQFVHDSIKKLYEASSTDTVRGIEGSAARIWFGLFADMLDKKWAFAGRNRRPPRDPVNAMLSLAYTLLVSEVRRAVHERGVDPCIGFLHEPYPARESLVLDLTEPFRPGVDAFVLSLAADVMEPGDFTIGTNEGCRLSKDARSIFYNKWEDAKLNWPLMPPSSEKSNENSANLSLQAAARNITAEFVRYWKTLDDSACESKRE